MAANPEEFQDFLRAVRQLQQLGHPLHLRDQNSWELRWKLDVDHMILIKCSKRSEEIYSKSMQMNEEKSSHNLLVFEGTLQHLTAFRLELRRSPPRHENNRIRAYFVEVIEGAEYLQGSCFVSIVEPGYPASYDGQGWQAIRFCGGPDKDDRQITLESPDGKRRHPKVSKVSPLPQDEYESLKTFGLRRRPATEEQIRQKFEVSGCKQRPKSEDMTQEFSALKLS